MRVIFRGILSIPQNNVLDTNNVMHSKDSSFTTFEQEQVEYV